MSDMRKLAEQTSEIVRDLVSQLLIKHELSVLEVMRELKAENNTLRAAAEKARAALLDVRETLLDARAWAHDDALRALDEALVARPG